MECGEKHCIHGGCWNNCSNGDTECYNDDIRKCENDNWVIKENCGDGNTCIDAKCYEKCDPNGEKYKYVCNTSSNVVTRYYCGRLTGYSPYIWRNYDSELCFDPCVDGSECMRGENHSCTDGDKACGRKQSFVCKGGKWTYGPYCQNGCDGDECKANACEGDEIKCSVRTVYQCISGNWQKIKDCDDICNKSGECICSTDEPYCYNGNVGYCLDGKEHIKTCDYGCDGGECKAPCSEGTTRCKDGYTAQECVGGRWGNDKSCQVGCSGGSCLD